MVFVAVWLSGNIVGLIKEVTLRPAGLVLRWVTVHGNTASYLIKPQCYRGLVFATPSR